MRQQRSDKCVLLYFVSLQGGGSCKYIQHYNCVIQITILLKYLLSNLVTKPHSTLSPTLYIYTPFKILPHFLNKTQTTVQSPSSYSAWCSLVVDHVTVNYPDLFSVCMNVSFPHFQFLFQNHNTNFNQHWDKAFLHERNFSLFKWKDMPYWKGDNINICWHKAFLHETCLIEREII